MQSQHGLVLPRVSPGQQCLMGSDASLRTIPDAFNYGDCKTVVRRTADLVAPPRSRSLMIEENHYH